MKNRFSLQLVLALFWFLSAFLAVGALTSWEWGWRCAWLNLIIGMLSLLFVTRTKLGERLFYEGPRGNEDNLWQIGLLWAIPMVIFFLAGIWWAMRLLGLFKW